MLVFVVRADLPPENSVFDCGCLARSNWMVPPTRGSRFSGRGPALIVEVTSPPRPAAAPPAPPLVPPGPPPAVKLDPPPPKVFATTPEFTPRRTAPDLARRTSVSAISRL